MRFSCRSALHDVQHAMQPRWLAIPADIRGHHAQLVAIAADLADEGRIAGARLWSVPQWYQRAGFHPRYQLPRLEQYDLVRWEGDDLVVAHYVVNHERRLRWLFHRGPELTDIRLGRSAAPPSAGSLALGSQRVNCAKVLKTPTTVPCNGTVNGNRQRNPDPLRSTASSGARPRAADPDPTLRSDSVSVPPVPSGKGSQTRQPPGRSSGPARPPGSLASRLEHSDPVLMALPTDGPEGFERWVRAMPVVRRPRTEAAARRWRDENLALWARYDLEAETDEIVAEVERRKHSFNWRKGFVPSPINFLRAATWRRRPKVVEPEVWGAPEVFEPSPTWRPPAGEREKLEDYLKSLVRS